LTTSLGQDLIKVLGRQPVEAGCLYCQGDGVVDNKAKKKYKMDF